MVVMLFLSFGTGAEGIAEDDPPELQLVTFETVTAPRPPSLFPSLAKLEDMLVQQPLE